MLELDSRSPAAVAARPLETLAAGIAQFPHQALPETVVEAAVRGLIDLQGVTIAGAIEPELRPLLTYIAETHAGGSASALGLGDRLVPEGAAWVNGTAGHMLDFDDIQDNLGGHPSVVILPPLLALAEVHGWPAPRVLEAYVLGVEVAAVLGRCLNHTHYERGWHPTATLGIFGCTAACARLLGLDTNAINRALAIAASFASGIKGNFGTFMKPGQVGFAASKGLIAARLAVLGATANTAIFSGSHSFPEVFNAVDPSTIDWTPLTQLGEHFHILTPGLVFKLYPCCGSTHAPLDAIIALRRTHQFKAADIAHIDIAVHPRRLPHINRPFPTSGLEAKFSVQYAVAVAAATGAAGMADFADEAVGNPEVQALLPLIQTHHLPPEEQTILPGRVDCFAGRVTVRLRNGAEFSIHVDAPRGSDPAAPVPGQDLEDKFLATAGTALPGDTNLQALALLLGWTRGTVALQDYFGLIRPLLRAAAVA